MADGTTYDTTFILANFESAWELIDVVFHLGGKIGDVCQGSCKSPDKFRLAIGKKSLIDIFPYRTFDRNGREMFLDQVPVDRVLASRDKQREFIQSMRGG